MIYFILLAPIIVWLAFRVSMPNATYEMDHGPIIGSFHTLLQIYHRLFYSIMWAGLALACAAWFKVAYGPMQVLAAAAVYGLLFNGILTFMYDGYLAQRYPRDGSPGVSNYTVTKYSFVLALGWSSAAMFIGGLAWLMVELAK